MDWLTINTFLGVGTINLLAGIATAARWKRDNNVSHLGLAIPLVLMALAYYTGMALLFAGWTDESLNTGLRLFIRFNVGSVAFAIFVTNATEWKHDK